MPVLFASKFFEKKNKSLLNVNDQAGVSYLISLLYHINVIG